MSDSEPDIIDRIDAALSGAGLSQRALAERSGLSVTQMNRVMTRQRKLTATELAIIADALDVSAAALLGETDRRLGMAARVGNAQRAPELEGPFRRAENLMALRELLDRVMSRPDTAPTPKLKVPTSGRHKDQGATLAGTVRGALGLGNGRIDDLEDLAALFGLDVSTQPLPDNLHGLLVADSRAADPGMPGAAVALLNSRDTLGRRRFTLAHELGHLLFRDAELAIADYNLNTADTDTRWTPKSLVELRASCFAKHLLAPDDAVRAVAAEVDAPEPNRISWGAEVAVEVAVRFGISFETAANRINDVDLLTNAERAAVAKFSANDAFIAAGHGEDRALLDPSPHVQPPAAMLTQALTAYQQEMLGVRPLATLYDLSSAMDIEGLRQQLRSAGWAPQAELTDA